MAQSKAEAARRVNYHYMADVMRRLEWDLHQKLLTEGRIPEAWHDIAAEQAGTTKSRVTIRLDGDVVKFFRDMGPGWIEVAADAIADEVRTSMQATLDSYGAGIQINTVSIEDAAPPREVADAFEEVQRAEQDEDRFREEANQYSNQQLGQARGEAAQIREDAAAYATQVVQEAEGEAQRFISIYDQYRLAPDVTRKRLFLETMEGVLGNSNKVILDEEGGGSGVVPYLPLPEIQNRRQTTAQDGVNQ